MTDSGNGMAEIVWIEPPEQMAEQVALYGMKVLAAVAAVAAFIGVKMQNESRRGAPWEDRTGNARSALFCEVESEIAEQVVSIYLSHGSVIEYGKFLELAHGQRYAVIMPTIERNLPELERMLRELFR